MTEQECEQALKGLKHNRYFLHFRSLVLNVFLLITDKPEIECRNTMAEYQQKLAKLQCIVRATPQLKNERYLYNETIAGGNVVPHWIQVGESAGSMYFRKEVGVSQSWFLLGLESLEKLREHFLVREKLDNFSENLSIA